MADAHLQQFIESLERSLAGGRFVKLTLAKHRGAESDLKNVYVRLVEIKSRERADFQRCRARGARPKEASHNRDRRKRLSSSARRDERARRGAPCDGRQVQADK